MKNMIDICGGNFTLREIIDEVTYQVQTRKPKRIIVDMRLWKKKYYTRIFLGKDDFKN